MAIATIAMMAMNLTSCDNQANAEATNIYSRIERISANDLNAEQTVYMCTGPQSKRFHKISQCRGLNSCSGDILEITISKAKSMGRTPCKWCYK